MAIGAPNRFYVNPLGGADVGGGFLQGMQMRQTRDKRLDQDRERQEEEDFKVAWGDAKSYPDKLRVLDQYPNQAANAREQLKFSSAERAGIHLAAGPMDTANLGRQAVVSAHRPVLKHGPTKQRVVNDPRRAYPKVTSPAPTVRRRHMHALRFLPERS